ncbi:MULTISPECIES: response regulator transcription factor [Haloarcula]|uniref:DNA-binding protein n=1 Tax=Haloarcula pellucida TaxID=1427151 RepID=A0A830GK69_9EURY|nr:MULTISPECIES: response regulator [Halomicroarcula]MBX0347616.1 response regulator [Halomicroarcula pellucida]MDS0276463.1 response regulator [Halomicroarcula sp. S1AR25-4]GGN89594.1 DNA-binding protein [Halomicroarcula pellucida]
MSGVKILDCKHPQRQVVTSEDETPTVLIVEDEQHLADLYTDYLSDQFDVETAYSGEEGIEMLSPTVDVVLLDRRMPVVSGNEVLAEIEERSLDCRVAMVTAVNPDFDIIDMGVDDYLVKPVTREDLTDVVDRLDKIATYNEELQRLTSRKLKRNVLQVEKTQAELDGSEQYRRLQSEIADIEKRVDTLAAELDVEEKDLRL